MSAQGLRCSEVRERPQVQLLPDVPPGEGTSDGPREGGEELAPRKGRFTAAVNAEGNLERFLNASIFKGNVNTPLKFILNT